MSLRIDGLISGLDITSLVQKLIDIERQPVKVLQEQKSLIEGQKALYQDLNTRLLALMGTVSPLTNLQTFQAKTANVSDPTFLTATASSSAAAATYQLVVQQLAQQNSIASDSQLISDASTPLATRFGFSTDQTFTLNINGQSTPVTITTADTLVDLRDKINNSGAAVTGSIVNDSATTQRLILTSKNSGKANQLFLTDSADGLLTSLGVLLPGTSFSQDFNSGFATGFTPPGGPGATTYAVTPTPGAFDPTNVYEGTAPGTNDLSRDASTFSESSTDYLYSADFQVTSDGTTGGAPFFGAFLRKSTPNDYVAVRLFDNGPPFTPTLDFVVVEGGAITTQKLVSVPDFRAATGKHALQVNDTGTQVSVTLDGQQVISDFSYATAVAAGTKGVSVTGDAVVTFDNISVSGTPKNVLTAAQDAQFTLNGLTITRPTNTVSDVIDGVTLNLLQADPAKTVTLTVTQDTDTVKKTIQNFVDQYNNLINLIKEQFFFNEEKKKGGILLGEGELLQIENFLQTPIFAQTDSSQVTELVGVGDGVRGNLFGQFALQNPVASLSDIASITVNDVAYTVRKDGGAFAGGGNQVEVRLDGTLRFDDNSGTPVAVANNGIIRATYRPAQRIGTGNGVVGTTLGDFTLPYVPRSLSEVRVRVDNTEFTVVPVNGGTGAANEVQVDLTSGKLKFNVAPATGSSVFASVQPTSGPGSLQGLSDIGISTASISDPTLVIDDGKLSAALSSNPDGVANLFAANKKSIGNQINDVLQFLTQTGDQGFLSNVDQLLQTKIDDIDQRVASFEEILKIREERIRNDFVRMEQALGVLQAQSAFLLQQINRLPGGGTTSSSSTLPGLK